MFFHIYKYRLKGLVRNWQGLFWTLAFPMILGTLFFVTFGNFMNREEKLQAIPVAAVMENQNSYFKELLDELSKPGADQIMNIQYTNEDAAGKLLSDGDVDGVFYVSDTVQLMVKKTGINQSILSSLLDSYLQAENMIKKAIKLNPASAEIIMKNLNEDVTVNKEITLSSGNQDAMMQYFYALLAMACLYGCFLGLYNAGYIQANLTTLAARKMTSPVHRMTMIMGEFAAAVSVQFCSLLILMGYLRFILGVDFGNKIPAILFLAFVGTLLGVSMGFFAGCIGRTSLSVKTGIMIALNMFLCFFSGLFINTIKNDVEQVCPIINRINPAVVLSDAFYALDIYDTYDRYFKNIIILLIFTAIFCIGGFLLARRKKYASL